MSNIKFGVTLYCFSVEYAQGKLTLEDMTRTCAELGATGYEIVATQMIPSYPFVDDKFIGRIKRCEELYGIKPVCYGANMDRGMRPDRDLTEDEMLANAIRDVKSAAKMGCHVLRHQYLMGPNVLRRLAPYAEEYDVKVGIEIHNPELPSSPAMLAYLEQIEASGSKYIGFVPDMGCFATKPNKPNWNKALKAGAPEELLRKAAQLRYDGVDMKEAEKIMLDAGANQAVMSAMSGMYGFVTFYKEPDIEGLKRIMPYCFEFHTKFHYMYPDHEASIPYELVLPIIAESDFDGYLISEYEDHESGENTIEQVNRHLNMEKKLLGVI